MQRLLAKALYDNVAESPDELAFKRGDVITVMEQETGGLEGWWLCSLRGKQGIAPGNRLKLLPNLVANHVRSHTADFPSSAKQKAEQEWNRRSWDGSSHKVVTPNRCGDHFMYDKSQVGQHDYDVPTARYPGMIENMYNVTGSNHSSREDLLNASAASSFEQSFYDTPSQGQSFNTSPEDSMYDTPPSHLHLDPYDIPSGLVRTSLSSKFSDESMSLSSGLSNSKSNPASMCDSARSSMDISPMDMYDVPPSQREHEARAALYPIRSSKDSGLDMYDSPPKLKSPPSMLDDYDVPKLAAINSERENQFRSLKLGHSELASCGDFLEDYDVPKSSPFSLNMMDYGNGSRGISQSDMEDYDVPKESPQVVLGKPPIAGKGKRQKSNSLGSLLDDYDTPQSRYPQNVSKDDLFTKSPTRDKFNQHIGNDGNDYDEPDAQPSKQVPASSDNTQKLQKREHAIDDLYDSPINNALVKNMTKEFSAISVSQSAEPLGVYDIPPQVTRDSIISSKSDSSDSNDGNNRLSTCSTDSRCSDIPIYDELPLELDAANDLVIKLQQDVQKAVNKFSTFIHSSWRKKDHLEHKLYDINQSCSNMAQKLGEFVEFGQGTLANSAKLSDRKLISKLSKYLIPLQQALQQLRVCIKHLDDVDWRVSKLVASESPKKDDLAIIASITKDLTSDVRKLASFIQGNSSLLFKRAKDFNRGSRNLDHSAPTSTGTGKPLMSCKPELPLKSLNLSTAVQARPLPAPPPAERPLPPTPDKLLHEYCLGGLDMKRLSGEISSKRNSGEFRHWSGEIQVKRLSVDRNSESDRSLYRPEDLIQEYDYVELEEDKVKVNEKDISTTEDELGVMNVNVKDLDMKASASYEKEMEKTLDEIDGVNIYMDESGGTLKRDTKAQEIENVQIESDHDTGTLKRRNENKTVVGKTESNSGTLKRQEKDSCEANVEEEAKVAKKTQTVEVPEHDQESDKIKPLEFEDKQVLAFYSEQLETHTTLLTNSIDAFFSCIEKNNAPKVFISHSKFVVVSAHKLVYIGDSLHRNMKHELVRSKIIQCANILCDNLKLTVTATKTAALQYPSVPAVQHMVDKVVDVSHAAHNLKLLIAQASKLST